MLWRWPWIAITFLYITAHPHLSICRLRTQTARVPIYLQTCCSNCHCRRQRKRSRAMKSLRCPRLPLDIWTLQISSHKQNREIQIQAKEEKWRLPYFANISLAGVQFAIAFGSSQVWYSLRKKRRTCMPTKTQYRGFGNTKLNAVPFQLNILTIDLAASYW